jgi:hypothetical protein
VHRAEILRLKSSKSVMPILVKRCCRVNCRYWWISGRPGVVPAA